MYCSVCQEEIPDDAHFCPACGAAQPGEPATAPAAEPLPAMGQTQQLESRSPLLCLRCQVPCEPGHLPISQREPLLWVKGQVDYGLFQKQHSMYEIRAYRCPICGRLELIAQ